MATHPLPPPLIVRPKQAEPASLAGETDLRLELDPTDRTVNLRGVDGRPVVTLECSSDDVPINVEFARMLVAIRASREQLRPPIVLHEHPDGNAGDGLAIPHVFVTPEGTPRVLFESLSEDVATELFDAETETIRQWVGNARELMELAALSRTIGSEDQQASDEHLSFRWCVRNQVAAAQWLARKTALDHVSVHIDPRHQADVETLLSHVLRLVPVARPNTIRTPGLWYAAGNTMIHVSTRSVAVDDGEHSGSAPNHLCISVDDLSEARRRLDDTSIGYTWSGSLGEGRQLWVRVGSLVIEIQASIEGAL